MTIDTTEAARLVKEGYEMTHGERMALRKERLRTLVEYAREHSPYLRELYSHLPEDYTLSDLPVTEKAAMIAHYDEWVTDPEVKLKDVEAFCNRDTRDGRQFRDQYTVLHTSGTTGSPLYMVRDSHRNRIHGQMLVQRLLNGFGPDIMNHTKHRIAGVIYTVHGASSYEGGLRQKYAVPGYEDNMLLVSVLDSIEEIVRQLNDFQPEVVSGYGSVLTALALEQAAGRLHIPAKAVFNSAETLTPENHALIERAFGCPVKNNYCMTEGGEIAMTVDGPDMLLNEDWIIVEPVDGEMKPITDPSRWSGGILVTDLANFVQPVIRYYVSDSVRVEQIPEDQVRLPRFRIRGRVDAVFTIAGMTFSTAGIGSEAEFWNGVADFQFVQVDDDELQLRVVWNPGAAEDYEALSARIKSYFDEHGCPAAKVSWSGEHPVRNSRGGKTLHFIDLRK